jgi:hypothetical protein
MQKCSYEVVTPDGLMRPALAAKRGGLYCGGSARMVEKALGVSALRPLLFAMSLVGAKGLRAAGCVA